MDSVSKQTTTTSPGEPGDDSSRFLTRELSWRLFDSKFTANRRRYIQQCVMATLVILAVLLVLDEVTQTVLIASLGASAFICFTMPKVNASRPRYLIGGYLIGTFVGGFMSLAAGHAVFAPIAGSTLLMVFGAIAIGLAIFCMVITDTEHPPAAALALGYVLNEWDMMTVAVVLIGIIALSAMKEASKQFMIDLL